MQSHHLLIKIITIIVLVAIILIAVSLILGRGQEPASEPVYEGVFIQGNENQPQDITDGSSVEADMEAYLNSGGVPNPNDFNDSYSDLSQ